MDRAEEGKQAVKENGTMVKRLLPFVLVGVVCAHAREAQYPAVIEETFVLKDF